MSDLSKTINPLNNPLIQDFLKQEGIPETGQSNQWDDELITSFENSDDEQGNFDLSSLEKNKQITVFNDIFKSKTIN
jgi:hypothetical protein